MADGKIVIDVDLDSKGAEEEAGKLGDSLSSKLGKGLEVVGGAIAAASVAAATAIGAMGVEAVKAYADYEQLAGGVQTLFGDDVMQTVMNNASEAFKTAGVSANEYMELATSSAAAMINSLNGDTAAAAEKTDMAIRDMADNSNKMGTELTSIQNAYAGFSKGNFTMLDNLKLGYGGTKEEMQRLLDKAQEISGIKYDISSYADIVDAIHVVQTEMGITGTTAKEASETISGSFGMLKGAWENLVAGFANPDADIGALVGDVADSVGAVVSNLAPIIANVLPNIAAGFTQLADSLAPQLVELISSLLPVLLEGAVQLVETLSGELPGLIGGIVEAISGVLPSLIEAVVDTLVSSAPALIEGAVALFSGLAQGLAEAVPTIVEAIPELLTAISGAIVEGLPQIIAAGIELLSALAEGLPEAIDSIVAVLPTVVTSICDALLENIGDLVAAGVELLEGLIEDLPTIIETLMGAMPAIIDGIVGALLDNIDSIIDAGVDLLTSLVTNLPEIIEAVLKAVPDIVNSLFDAFVGMTDKLADAGEQLIKGLWSGITNVAEWLWGKISGFCSDLLGRIKGFFGISSPSKVFRDVIGKNLMIGWAEGIEDNAGLAVDAMADAAEEVNKAALTGAVKAEMNRVRAVVSAEMGSVGVCGVNPNAGYHADLLGAASARTTVSNRTSVEFTGSLAQLGRVLQPVIRNETDRLGADLVTV